MIDGYANRVAQIIKNTNKEEETASVEVMQYGLIILFNGIAVFFLAFLIGIMTGMFLETFITCIVFAIVRQVSGGFHFESGMLCILTSTLLLSTLPQAVLIIRFRR
jgi:accessory gene regulator B